MGCDVKILISGGAKNGKSMYAQKIAKAMSVEYDVPLYYVATMEPVDEEDKNRIQRHVHERVGWGFITIEEPRKLAEIFERGISSAEDAISSIDRGIARLENVDERGVFLVDSLTALLGNNMFLRNGNMNLDCFDDVCDDIYRFSMKASNIVLVSDAIGCDGTKFDKFTEEYRRTLARLEREIASYYDRVNEVSVGQIIEFK